MSKPSSECPLCEGTGKVSKRVAKSKITVVDREKWNASMRVVNKRARERKKAQEALATS